MRAINERVVDIHKCDLMEALSVIQNEIAIMDQKIKTLSEAKRPIDVYMDKKKSLEFKRDVPSEPRFG